MKAGNLAFLKYYKYLFGFLFLTVVLFSMQALAVTRFQNILCLSALCMSWSCLWLLSFGHLEKLSLFPIEKYPMLLSTHVKRNKHQSEDGLPRLWWIRSMRPEAVSQIVGYIMGPLCSIFILDSTVYYFSARIIYYSMSIILAAGAIPLSALLYTRYPYCTHADTCDWDESEQADDSPPASPLHQV